MCGPAKVALRPQLLILFVGWQLSCHILVCNGQTVTNVNPLLEEENLLVIEKFLEVIQKFLKQSFPADAIGKISATSTTTTTTGKPRKRLCFKSNCFKFKKDKDYIF